MVLLEKLGKLFKRCASAEPEFWLPGSESGEGALVFWDYGWDLLDWMKEAGFSDAYLQPYYSRKHGHMGAPQYYFTGVG